VFFFPNFSVNNITTGGSFNHKTIVEGEVLLDHIPKNTISIKTLHVEPKSSHEEVSSAEFEPIAPIQRLLPEPKTSDEGFQPSEFPFFEDEFHEDFGNTSKYSYQKRPPVPIIPLDPLDKELLRESVKELLAIMSSEWVEETERSSEEI